MSLCDAATLEDRFWDKVYRGKDEACWPWLGGKSNGYGRMFLGRENGRMFTSYAHRFSYELHVGPISEGLEVDHTCCNRACVNPAHLELVSGRENKVREGARQTRCTHGHTYTPANTYIDGRGHRRCRTCAQQRRWAA